MSRPFVSAILALPHLRLPTSQKTNDVDLWISQCQGNMAAIAQLGERQTEDLKVPGSIPGLGIAQGYAHVHDCIKSQVNGV